MTVQWYTAEEGSPQDRLLAAWEDAPIENLEVLGMILSRAKAQVIAYAPELDTTEIVYPDPITRQIGVDTSTTGLAGTVTLRRYAPSTVAWEFDMTNVSGSTRTPGVIGDMVLDADAFLPLYPSLYLIEANGDEAAMKMRPDGVLEMSWGSWADEEQLTFTIASAAAVADEPADGYPDDYAYAQLQQAMNLWNAGRASQDGTVGAEGFMFIPRPLDKTIRGIIRPIDGRPDVY